MYVTGTYVLCTAPACINTAHCSLQGFWSFANTAHSPPAVSDLLATEVSADLYVPSFMSTFFTNYNSHAPQDIIEILSINNVHIHNFNIQPLLEFDIQFQAQPQAQAQLNVGTIWV